MAAPYAAPSALPIRASHPARRTTYVCAAVTATVGGLVLFLGWLLKIEAMRSVVPGTPGMRAPTAFMFLLSGIALGLLATRSTGRRLWAGRALAIICIVISGAYLVEYVFGISLGIDERVFRDTVGRAQHSMYPGRPAPLTAISFVLVACALLTIDARRRWTEPLTAPVVVIGATCLIGYLYAIPAFYGPASAAKMAINTAALFLVIAVGVVLARPRGALQALLASQTPGGIMIRKLLPIAIAVPLLLGWLRLMGHDAGLFGLRVGTWWLTAATITCLVLVVVTASRGLDRAVRGAHRRFETAFEHAPIGIAIVDVDGRIVTANRALGEITGHEALDLVATDFAALVHPDDRDEYQVAREQLLYDGGQPYTLERRYVRRDGGELWGRHSATLVRDDGGRPLYFIVQVQDVSRQREVDRLKEEFVSLVTHELRTPLTSVAGYLDIVLEDDDEDVARLDPQHAHHVGVARRNTQRLMDLVEDLLLIRRLEAGREELSPDTLDLSALAADRLESVAPMASAKDVTIDGQVAPGVVVDADPRRIAQVVDNLLANAIKYTPDGGNVRLTLAIEGAAVALAVADTGIGIPESDQVNLFDPFFRASNVSGSAVPGTGLGLVVTRRLIEAHGGTIEVESAVGVGSRFIVRLPTALVPLDVVA
jgi:PAS domain S-box-containing protein